MTNRLHLLSIRSVSKIFELFSPGYIAISIGIVYFIFNSVELFYVSLCSYFIFCDIKSESAFLTLVEKNNRNKE